jgi:AcrR family transcriptional regulator
MADPMHNETRRIILSTAEDLFAARGYAAVRLRDIAEAVDMKHASLYYYVPGGKKQLFIEVMEHSFERHRDGIMEAMQAAGGDLRQQLYAVADWFITQPAMDLARMQQGDRPKLSADELSRLSAMAYHSLRTPLVDVLTQANHNATIAVGDANLAAMTLISTVQSVRHIPQTAQNDRLAIGHQIVDMLLDGWRPR